MTTSNIELILNNKQELALSIPTKRLLLTGAVRAGKSMAAALKVREIALRIPGSQILIMRKTLKELRDDVFKTMYNPVDGLIASSAIYGKLNKSNYEHVFNNGSKIIYRQADDEKKLLGLDLSAIYFEQAENIDRKIFEYALGRLTFWGDIRNPQSRGYRYIQKYSTGEYADSIAKRPAHFFILSCNPDTNSWIYDDIIRTCDNYTPFTPHIKHQDLGWDIVNFQTEDNVQLPDVKNFIEEQKKVSSDAYFRRMILGEWVGSEGMIFSHFDNYRHIISDWEYNERYEIVVGIDPGNSWYTGVVFTAYDKKTQKYIIFDEIKVRNTIIPDIAEMIHEKLKGWKIDENKVKFVIDAAANIKESNGTSKADQYKQNKIYVVNANKKLGGSLERINGLFKQNMIFICGYCTHMLNDIKSYKYNEHGQPDKGTGEKASDMNDSMRYTINQFAYGLGEYVEPAKIETDGQKRASVLITQIFNNIERESEEKETNIWGL